jgi:hypothetical protein
LDLGFLLYSTCEEGLALLGEGFSHTTHLLGLPQFLLDFKKLIWILKKLIFSKKNKNIHLFGLLQFLLDFSDFVGRGGILVLLQSSF